MAQGQPSLLHYSSCVKYYCSVCRTCMNCEIRSLQSDSNRLSLVHQPTDMLKVSPTDDECETFPLNINIVSDFSCGRFGREQHRPLQRELFPFQLFLLCPFKLPVGSFQLNVKRDGAQPSQDVCSLLLQVLLENSVRM